MDKKDIYEHLAKIYLDTTPPGAGKKKQKSSGKHKAYYFFAAAPFVVLCSAFFLHMPFRGVQPSLSTTSLIVSSDTIKMNFNLGTAKKQCYALDLNRINLNGYKTLVFSLRNSNYNDTLSFRVEFANAFKERAEQYVNGITNKWKEIRINLSDFKGISDWSEMNTLSFIVEEWNTRDHKGIIFIDEVRFLK